MKLSQFTIPFLQFSLELVESICTSSSMPQSFSKLSFTATLTFFKLETLSFSPIHTSNGVLSKFEIEYRKNIKSQIFYRW